MKLGKKQSRDSSKSNAAVLFNRYVWLVDLIYRAERISLDQIVDLQTTPPEGYQTGNLPF